jgi:hypothetical protein
MDSGPTQRRHILVDMTLAIGKEANEIEEDETFGADADSTLPYGLSPEQRTKVIAVIAAAPKRLLAKRAEVSDHTIDAAMAHTVSDQVLQYLYEYALAIAAEEQEEVATGDETVAWLSVQATIEGKKALAARLGVDYSYLVKIIAGERKPSAALIAKVSKFGP